MNAERQLFWDGCFNTRDLGGLRTEDGRNTKWGAVVRSDDPAGLTGDGWASLLRHGVRTIVDLTGGESSTARRPAGLTGVAVQLDDHADSEFWTRWDNALSCTPLYYRAFLDRFPRKVAEVLTAIAEAGPGGVLVHCSSGRDRTGLISLVLLAAVGVGAADIAADYALTHVRRAELCAAAGLPDDTPRVHSSIAEHGTSEPEVIADVVGSRDMAAYLRSAGVTEEHLAALRDRMLT
ncbi:tyrosine-protein phosphatase [Saccharopolyspora indica]|uniref:tyrosine-protein phosphatase n=1 Tax=Saccharopolyspora indica TaxID=1229659 RepID=UPI0022EA64AD|nr:tyrosine-protein phosphatase [Saccharopolyspora indica]MDA3643347.1 tyrosine-protein phosphatase [Saccharopolyspora indica]